jgi:hypothetical protein
MGRLRFEARIVCLYYSVLNQGIRRSNEVLQYAPSLFEVLNYRSPSSMESNATWEHNSTGVPGNGICL